MATLVFAVVASSVLALAPTAASLWARRAAGRVLGLRALIERRFLRDEGAPFAHLATSQVGYGAEMRKEFTSPAAFGAFVVQDEQTGKVVFTGGSPVRTLTSEVLGSLGKVWIGDFSPFFATGRYRVSADNGLTSLPFELGGDVFDGALRATQRWFYYQRAFSPVLASNAEGPWTHPDDADKAPPAVQGGWHDAGDFSVYSASLNEAIFWLLSAYSDFSPRADNTNIPESGNGIPDVLDEARWGLQWLLSVQDASGGFRNSTCQQSYGPYGTNTPNNVPKYLNGEVGTLSTARAIGNLAYAFVIFRNFDPLFAERCIRAARDGARYLEAHPTENTDGPTCPALRRDGDKLVGQSTRMFAAAGMLLATGESRFRDAFEAAFAEPAYDPGFLHLNGPAALLYLRAPAGDERRKRALRERLRANADVALAEGAQHPFGWASRYLWGSLGVGFQRASLNSVPLCLENPSRASADCEQAMASLHYAFGRNSKQFCYVTGLPGTAHSMQWGFHHWLETLNARPRDFPGMVAGGPSQMPEPTDVSTPQAKPVPLWGYWGDPAFPRDARTPVDGRYTDNDSWSTNEPSVVWEAEAVYLLHFAQWLAKGDAPRAGSR